MFMHEMSIALGIVDIAKKEAKKANISSFSAIDLEIGTLAGIEFDSLEFVWDAAVKNTPLEHAEKTIHKINAKAQCGDCDYFFKLTNMYDTCPKCGSFFKIVLQGKELKVKSLEY
jgi:hydrogenase nickel incorporation protein HypA/HybF